MKTYLIDTSMILYNPECYNSFSKAEVLIPTYVIDELRQFRKDWTELGNNSRIFKRNLSRLRSKGSLKKGIKLKNNSILKIVSPIQNNHWDIISYAQKLKKNKDVYLVSQDISLQIKADFHGIQIHTPMQNDWILTKDFYNVKKVSLTQQQRKNFLSYNYVEISKKCNINQFIELYDNEKNFISLARISKHNQSIAVPLLNDTENFFLNPLNNQQSFALEALLDDSIKLVSLIGAAGTGKTLLAVAVGLYKTLRDPNFEKLLISRPIIPIGRDIGALPGTIDQKMEPWMQPIYDALECIRIIDAKSPKPLIPFSHSIEDIDCIKIEPLTYIRGRSINKQFLIIDEAQNLSPLEIKTIITRAGKGVKIVLCGDPYQIDTPYLDIFSNGLTYTAQKFLSSPIAAYIFLAKGERSQLAQEAVDRL